MRVEGGRGRGEGLGDLVLLGVRLASGLARNHLRLDCVVTFRVPCLLLGVGTV